MNKEKRTQTEEIEETEEEQPRKVIVEHRTVIEKRPIITAEEAKKVGKMMDEAKQRGVEKVKGILSAIRRRYEKAVEDLDKKIVIPPSVVRGEAFRKKSELRMRVLKENLETRKAIIRLNKKIDQLESIAAQLTVILEIEQDPFQQVINKSRLDITKERILKMKLTESSLEGTLSALNTAVVQLQDDLFLDKIMPADLDDLFAQIDGAQLSANQMAVEDVEIAKQEMEKNGINSY